MMSYLNDVERTQLDILKKIVLKNQESLSLDAWQKISLGLDVSEEKLGDIEKIILEHERLIPNFNYLQLESEFEKIGIEREKLKQIIKYFLEDNLYIEVIKHFLTDMDKSGMISSEYKQILKLL